MAVAEAAYDRAGTLAASRGRRPLVAECRPGARMAASPGRAATRWPSEHLAAAAVLFETLDMPRGLAAARVELAATG